MEALVDGPREVAVVGPAADVARVALHRVALAGAAPGLVVAAAEVGATTPPLVADRPLVAGRAAAYPCRGMVCDLPLTEVGPLARWAQAAGGAAGLPTANTVDASE